MVNYRICIGCHSSKIYEWMFWSNNVLSLNSDTLVAIERSEQNIYPRISLYSTMAKNRPTIQSETGSEQKLELMPSSQQGKSEKMRIVCVLFEGYYHVKLLSKGLSWLSLALSCWGIVGNNQGKPWHYCWLFEVKLETWEGVTRKVGSQGGRGWPFCPTQNTAAAAGAMG